MKKQLGWIAQWTGGELEGSPDYWIEGVAGLAEAGEKDIAFLENPKYAPQVASSRAGCVFLPMEAKGRTTGGPKNRIYVVEPKWAFAQVLTLLEADLNPPPKPGIHPKAEVHPEAEIGRDVSIGAFAVIERSAVLADGAAVGPQCYVGARAKVGKGTRLYPQVVLREGCVLGERVIVHSGTVIGSDGYGFSTDPKTGAHRKVPQIGNVVVGDDVEIGSNVSIDRATTGSTLIGAGSKIDNLVQIAHNVAIGRNCLIVSQVGIAGSTQVGNQVVLAGQVGVIGHLKIGDGAVLTAQTGVISDVEAKAVLFGSPARPHREAMRIQALLGRLPDLFDTVKELKAKVLNTQEELHAGKR